MVAFRFLHAADIHLDSPMRGLSRYDGLPLDDIRSATRTAFDRMIQFAIDEMVNFVVIAGDLFDGDWRDMSTGLYFARAVGRLSQLDIPVFILAGNHDAASVLTKSLPWPDGVKRFDAKKPQTYRLDDIAVALHGQSFASAHVMDNLARAYPAAVPGYFNIGVLHTALTGHAGHQTYAPCSIVELQAKGYDYWALGHVHDFAVLCTEPHIVFPGNLQGRNIRETGSKGAVLVEVEDGVIARLGPVPLGVMRWMRVEVDCAGADDKEAIDARISAALRQAVDEEPDAQPTIARVVIGGVTALAGALYDHQGELRDEVRARAAAIAPDRLWIEKLEIAAEATTAPLGLAAPEMSEDFAALLAEARTDPTLLITLADDLADFLAAAPAPEKDVDDPLAAAAQAGDWQPMLAAAAASLEARLTTATDR